MAGRTNDEIREAVARAYGSRVSAVAHGEAVPMAETCCGPDCCAPAEPGDGMTAVVRPLYAEEDVAGLPETVTGVAFGCGNPTAIAALEPGQVVLDLGSGGGIDCFLAGKAVGDEGHVIGVDMTPGMVALARKNAATVGAANVEFRLGEIEQLPVADASVDVIISNCVINLSPEKERVFAEAFRVLRPGGRLQVSDIVWTEEPPADIRADMEAWAGCIAGAEHIDRYLALIRAAGFEDVTVELSPYPERGGIASAAIRASKRG